MFMIVIISDLFRLQGHMIDAVLIQKHRIDSGHNFWPLLHLSDFNMANQGWEARGHFPHMQIMHREYAWNIS